MILTKDIFEQLSREYRELKQGKFPIHDFYRQPAARMVIASMENPSVRKILREYPMPEIFVLDYSHALSKNDRSVSPLRWLYSRMFSQNYDKNTMFREFLFGFDTVQKITDCYPNPFAFTDGEIMHILPVFDETILSGLVTAWKSIAEQKEEITWEIEHYETTQKKIIAAHQESLDKVIETEKTLVARKSQIANEIAELNAEKEAVTHPSTSVPNKCDDLSTSTDSEKVHDQEATLSTEFSKESTDETDRETDEQEKTVLPLTEKEQKKKLSEIESRISALESEKSKISKKQNALSRQKKDESFEIDERKKELEAYIIPKKAVIAALSRVQGDKESIIICIEEHLKTYDEERSAVRSGLYSALSEITIEQPTGMVSIGRNTQAIEKICEKYAQLHQSGVSPEDDTEEVYSLFCEIMEYAAKEGITERYLPELEAFWAIPRKKEEEWCNILMNISRSESMADSLRYRCAAMILFLNTEGPNRNTLAKIISNYYLSLTTVNETIEFISSLMQIDESLEKKKNLLQMLMDRKQNEQLAQATKETRALTAKAGAKARERVFSEIYQPVQALEEYAWSQEARDVDLFERIADLRAGLKKVGIDTTVEPRLWINQEMIRFNSDIHHIDGTDIPEEVVLRTMGFKIRKEDGRDEVERAWVFAPKVTCKDRLNTGTKQEGINE